MISKARGQVVALIGIGALLLATLNLVQTAQFVREARRTEGTVVSLNSGPAHPQIEFVDRGGKNVRFPAGGCTSHRPGERVGVLYLANAPVATAVLDEPGSYWFLTGLFACLGACALVGGSFVALRR
jgi:hypothetical protein